MKKMNPKVFIATPHADRKNYCLEQYFEVINTLSYKNKVVLVADNSDSNKNTQLLNKMGIKAIHVKPKKKSNFQYICESHNALRSAFLRSNADIFFHLESDIKPPVDIIERLLSTRKRVVGAPYFIGSGSESYLVSQDIEKFGVEMKLTKRMDDGTDFMFIDGKLKKVHTIGLGCIMIDKRTLKKVPFRWEKGINAHPDSFFAHDLHMLGIPIWCDTSIIPEHNNNEWTNFKINQ